MHAGRAALQHRKGFWRLGARNAKVISAARDLGVESRFDLAQVFVQRPHKHREFACRRLKDVDKIFQVFFIFLPSLGQFATQGMRIHLSDANVGHLTDERVVALEVHHAVVIGSCGQKPFTLLSLTEHETTLDSAEHRL